MRVKVGEDMENALLETVRVKIKHLKCVAPNGIDGSWLNDLVKDVNEAFDKVASKATSDNAGCL